MSRCRSRKHPTWRAPRPSGRTRERAGERVGDDATSRNRYLRTAPGGRAGKSGENAFPQIILAAPPRSALGPFSSLRLGLSSAFVLGAGTNLRCIWHSRHTIPGDFCGKTRWRRHRAGGDQRTAAVFPSGELPPLTQTVSHSVASPLSLLPAYPPASLPPSVLPSVVGISVSPSSHRNETEWNGGGTGGGNRSYRPAGRGRGDSDADAPGTRRKEGREETEAARAAENKRRWQKFGLTAPSLPPSHFASPAPALSGARKARKR